MLTHPSLSPQMPTACSLLDSSMFMWYVSRWTTRLDGLPASCINSIACTRTFQLVSNNDNNNNNNSVPAKARCMWSKSELVNVLMMCAEMPDHGCWVAYSMCHLHGLHTCTLNQPRLLDMTVCCSLLVSVCLLFTIGKCLTLLHKHAAT